jgi:hypothetical protein
MAGPYTRVSGGDDGNSGPTAATTIVNAHSGGLEALEYRRFNVRDYGAVGDGTTNDTAAINAACAALNAAGGGTLYFPAGTYSTTGGHYVSAGEVIGQGRTVSRLKVTGSGNALTINKGVLVDNLTLYHLSTGPDYFDPTTGISRPTGGSGIQILGSNSPGGLANNWTIRNCTIRGFYINIYAQDVQSYNIHGCLLNAQVFANLAMWNPAWPDTGDFSISDTVFDNPANFAGPPYVNAPYHFLWQSGGGIKITNCKFNGGVQYGIALILDPGAVTGVVNISNNSIENFTVAGIYVQATSGNLVGGTIVGNEIIDYTAPADGIHLNGSAMNGWTVIGNAIGAGSAHIRATNVTRLTVAGNAYNGGGTKRVFTGGTVNNLDTF